MLQRYGKRFAQQVEQFKEKTKATVRERYGVENVMQVTRFFKRQQKSALGRLKIHIFADGRVAVLGGNEDLAAIWITSAGFVYVTGAPLHPSQIVWDPEEVQPVWWNDDQGNPHKYTVDFDVYIDIERTQLAESLEIKSSYTVTLDFELHQQKWQGAVDRGVPHRVIVIDRIGNQKSKSFVVRAMKLYLPGCTVADDPILLPDGTLSSDPFEEQTMMRKILESVSPEELAELNTEVAFDEEDESTTDDDATAEEEDSAFTELAIEYLEATKWFETQDALLAAEQQNGNAPSLDLAKAAESSFPSDLMSTNLLWSDGVLDEPSLGTEALASALKRSADSGDENSSTFKKTRFDMP